jgi:starvation-inducible DNA-binding protein
MPSAVSGPSFQTRIDLAPEVRQHVITVLNQQLAQTLDLYTQAKQAHWNVKGTDFFQLHELFDKVAEDVFGFVDTIAERVTALGGYAFGTARMAAANSSLPEYPKEAIDGRQHLEALIDRFARYVASNRKALDEAQSEGDAATADVYTEVARAADKALWFLEAHLQAAAQRAS